MPASPASIEPPAGVAPGGRTDRLVAFALALGAAALLLPLRPYGLMVSDDGWYLHPVLRMRAGEILYRDVWTYYAPLEHHLLAWWFELAGPSIVAARTLFAALIVAAVVCTYRLARRWLSPGLAWLPAALYALVPGPWHKAFLGLCTALFFVALARALERPGARRFAVLGAIAGGTLATRQDFGAMQIAIAWVAAALAALHPRAAGVGSASPRRAAAWTGATLAATALVLAPIAAYYAAQGALSDLVDAVFVRAAAQADAFPSPFPGVLSPCRAVEGCGAGALLLVPPGVYAALGAALLARIARRGLSRSDVLLGALLAYAVAMLWQAWHPPLLVRFLQTAIPFYVLCALAIRDAAGALAPRRAGGVAVAIASAAAAGLVWLVVAGVPAVRPADAYTGSIRMLRYDAPVEFLGDTLRTGWAQADEIRLARRFFDVHGAPGEPIFVAPMHPLYWDLLGRPNPTRFLADHAHGNFVMTIGEKEREAERLLASPARHALVEQQWYAQSGPRDPLRQVLWARFRPVRAYYSVLVLERGTDADGERLARILRRAIVAGQPDPADLAAMRDLAAAHPDEPLVWRLLGATCAAAGRSDEAVDAYHRAAVLDPEDAALYERSAALRIEAGRLDEAAADLERARALRDSPVLRDLARRAAGPSR